MQIEPADKAPSVYQPLGADAPAPKRQQRLANRGRGARSREDARLLVFGGANGLGVPESLRHHIFDPFVRARAGDSGLGLALVAKIVEEHGGVVELDQRPGRTIFRVLLPIGEVA